MKTTRNAPVNLFKGGRRSFENTPAFRQKVLAIEREVADMYSLSLVNERSWMKRLFIRIRLQLEIRRRIRELSSLRNLHLGARLYFTS